MSEQKTFIYQRRRPEETLLYKTLLENLSTFLANLQNAGRSLPRHVIKELHAYLECGVLAYGFVRLKCEDCRSEKFVAFSCKKRGFCPSCGAKKMAETAAYLVDNIIPHVKIRQYVLSVPIPLRYWMSSNKKLLAKIHKIFALSIEKFYTDKNTNTSRSGSICFVQRFGGALNLNVHFHLLQIEGVYEPRSTAVPKFKKTKPPSDLDIKNLVTIIREKIIKHLRRSGYIKDLPPDEDPTDLFDEEPTYAGLMSASVGHEIALGERQGQKVRFIGYGFGYTGNLPELKGRLCAYLGGFSLHAAISIPRYRRDELEKLIRYTARPSISIERMSLTKTGDIKYEFKKTWKNGVTHVVLSPHELIEKLCALIPQPRMHLVR